MLASGFTQLSYGYEAWGWEINCIMKVGDINCSRRRIDDPSISLFGASHPWSDYPPLSSSIDRTSSGIHTSPSSQIAPVSLRSIAVVTLSPGNGTSTIIHVQMRVVAISPNINVAVAA